MMTFVTLQDFIGELISAEVQQADITITLDKTSYRQFYEFTLSFRHPKDLWNTEMPAYIEYYTQLGKITVGQKE